jgi:hypothetical protein
MFNTATDRAEDVSGERKRATMRAATGRTIAPYMDGAEKERREKPRPITLPSAESLRKLDRDDG